MGMGFQSPQLPLGVLIALDLTHHYNGGTMTNMDMADYHRAYTQVSQTVAANDFSIHHDVDGIVQELWDTFGHFDFDIIGHDTDRYWAIINKHAF